MPEFKSITKKYGTNTVLNSLSLKIEKSSPTVIMGESGCGKTTLLRIAAGLEKADSGEFDANGEKLAYMFQEPRLIMQKNAVDNISAVLPKKSKALASKYLEMVGLDLETDGKKYPSELSGGMKQRVSLARAFLKDAPILLLDEPTKELDTDNRELVLDEIERQSKKRLVILVTHNENDARRLSAEILRLN